MLHAEGHFRWFDIDFQFLEKLDQVGISRMIKDNKSGIDRNLRPIFLHKNCVCMAARPGITFQQCHMGAMAKLPSDAHARNPGSYNGDAFPHWTDRRLAAAR